jgi:hypothetical protein
MQKEIVIKAETVVVPEQKIASIPIIDSPTTVNHTEISMPNRTQSFCIISF